MNFRQVMIDGISKLGGALIAVFLEASLFWWLWGKLVPVYFAQVPKLYQAIPFWHFLGLYVLIRFLRRLIISR